jgi:hypothetical protein
MAVRSKRIFGPISVPTAGSATQGPPPSGTKWLLKYFTFRFTGADRIEFQQNIGAGMQAVFNRTGPGGTASIEVITFILIESGDTFKFTNAGTNAVEVAVYGAELVL